MEFRLLGAAVLGAGSMLALLHLERRRNPERAWAAGLADRALTALVVGLFVGRLVAMVQAGTNPLIRPGDLIVVRGGVDTVAASAAAQAWMALSVRRTLVPSLDALAGPALVGLAGWHAGCLLRGACLGTASALPWAVASGPGAVPRHPVELYAAGLLLVIGLGLLLLRARLPAGVPAALGLAGAGAVRLLTEPLRPSLTGGPVAWYAAALLLGLAGAAWAGSRPAQSRRSSSPRR